MTNESTFGYQKNFQRPYMYFVLLYNEKIRYNEFKNLVHTNLAKFELL
jgi:hypothetical protein